MMEEISEPGILQKPYKLYKADSGGIRCTMVANVDDPSFPIHVPEIALIAKECPHQLLYMISFDYYNRNIIVRNCSEGEEKCTGLPNFLNPVVTREFWLSWYNQTLRMGLVGHEEFFRFHFPKENPQQIVGFVKFEVSNEIDWQMETPPIIKPIKYKPLEDGQLRWVRMQNDQLPQNAMIGGFEKEPIYIARAWHNGSLCPGKYVPSKHAAFIPWGHREHTKQDFEILCGYNAVWVKCRHNFIPENVFVAGSSEVRGDNLYIGRAKIMDDMVVGKVHMLYKTCYLPYKGKEEERYCYEILVRGDVPTRGITSNKQCNMNPISELQPCI